MSGRSCRSTTDRRPGLVDQPRKKRTTAEVQEDENRSNLAASARTKATELAHSSAVGRVAIKEDEMVREDQEARAHAARPDLLTADQSQPVTDADANSEEDIDMESEHGLDEPPDTDSDGMALGTEPEFDDFAAHGDNDGDENYVQSDEEDHDDSEVHPLSDDDPAADSGMDEAETQAAFAEFMKMWQSTGEKKKEKGLLRAEIVNSRDTAPIAAAPAATSLSKRKAAAPPPQIDPAPVTKRARAAEIGGLKANWKKAVRIDERGRGAASTSSHASSRSAMRDTSSKGDYGGTFAEDEPETSLQARVDEKNGSGTHPLPFSGEIKAYRKFAFPSALSDPAHSPFFSIEEAPSWITSHGYQLFLTHDDSETATSWDLDNASTKQLKAYRSHMVSEYYQDHPFFSLENTEAWISLIPFQPEFHSSQLSGTFSVSLKGQQSCLNVSVLSSWFTSIFCL
ncbi:hypothetical protein DFH08DRAFT_977204 [Mycena albidolilacea]|uniref:Uncharacterized protein n=1 Tax=Mycena albidolilacea TaxID=1033008 RepID=A0AAD6Z1K7_9AGAR|nr:hypothetical protein DFH08DRAFT_977204 [Mycena albidolilacea]